MKIIELENTSLNALRQMARDLDVAHASRLRKRI